VFKRDQLRYFVTVVEEQQITRASRRLHIAQPALSQSISRLEAQLGVQLLRRHARGVTPTAAGELFLDKAQALVAAEREASEAAAWLHRQLHGSVVIGTVGLPAWQVDPGLIEAFAFTHPAAELRPRELPFPSAPVGSWLAEVDLTISTVLSEDEETWVEPLRFEPAVVLAARSHRLATRRQLTVSEVLDETFIETAAGVDPVWAASWSLDDQRDGCRPARTVASPATLQGMVATIAGGAAISIAPALQAQTIAASLPGIAVIPLRDGPSLPVSLVGRKDRLSPQVLALRALAKDLADRRAARRVERNAIARDPAGRIASPGRHHRLVAHRPLSTRLD
jgi:DNA-binding transcriptional LysR family regulator